MCQKALPSQRVQHRLLLVGSHVEQFSVQSNMTFTRMILARARRRAKALKIVYGDDDVCDDVM